MLTLTSRIALTQQNLDQNMFSRMLGTLGVGVSPDRRKAEIHNPAPWPHVTCRFGSEPAKHIRNRKLHTVYGFYLSHGCRIFAKVFTLLPWELRWLTEDTFCRGISLCGPSVIVHQVRLHIWERRKTHALLATRVIFDWLKIYISNVGF